jgi:tRNA dimethylallyltransferase
MPNSKPSMILVLGVTASGKGRLAFELARRLGGELVSVDSMKVYRRMNIGTAKPSLEARRQIPHHLIDVIEPSEPFSVGRFLEMASAAIQDIQSRGRTVIAVGGTALYIKALLYGLFEGPGSDETIRAELRARIEAEGLAALHAELARVDPGAAERIHVPDAKRLIRALEVYRLMGWPISSFQKQFDATEPRGDWTIIGLRRDKEIESRRINARVKGMIDEGLVDEVKSLLSEDEPLSQQARCAIGYAEIIDYLVSSTEDYGDPAKLQRSREGRLSLDDAIEQIKINSRKLAKAQRTWFKRFTNVHWLDLTAEDTLETVLPRATALCR